MEGENMPRTEPAAQWVAIEKLTPWADNPRINEHAVDDVAKSIQRFGFASPIIARTENNEVIAGHTRLKAAIKLGLDKVPVRFMDLDPADARMLALADNRVAELADWDDDALATILRELDADGLDLDGLGWSDDALADLLAPDPPEPDGTEDDVPEVQDEVHSQPGEVYELGPHRLVCGDCTDPAVWDVVVGDEVPNCVFADPPYGIAYAGKGITAGGVSGNDFGEIIGDTDTGAAKAALRVANGVGADVEVWWGANYYCSDLPGDRSWVVWDKERIGEVYSDVELAWTNQTGRLRMFRHQWHGMVKASEHGQARVHPTQKPAALSVWCFDQFDVGSTVVDPFGGSGTTLIACAMTGRRARLIEIDPRYCDVIRRRWTTWAKTHDQEPGPGALE